jgi:deoxynucleoside kinase
MFKQLANTRPFYYVVIEGGIASGKTTIVNYLQKHARVVEIIEEPIHVWKQHDGINMLEKFYSDRKRYAFDFQKLVQCSRLDICIRPCSKRIRISERCLETVTSIFSSMLFQDGLLSKQQFAYLSGVETYFVNLLKCQPDMIVYLKTSPNIAYERLQFRGRVEERNVSLEYLQTLYNYYENWISKQNNVVIINGDLSLKEVLHYVDSVVFPNILVSTLEKLNGST